MDREKYLATSKEPWACIEYSRGPQLQATPTQGGLYQKWVFKDLLEPWQWSQPKIYIYKVRGLQL